MKYFKQDIKNWKHRINLLYKRFIFSKKLKSLDLIKDGYALIFSDDFETLSKDTWAFSPGWGTFHPENIKEHNKAPLNYWDPNGSALETSEGILKVKCYRINKEINFTDYDGKDYGNFTIPYNSGYLESKYETKYGYFEITCRIPKGLGYWPAFWMASSADWPPEIDIFEFYTDRKWYELFHFKQTRLKSGYYTGSKSKPIKRKSGLFGPSILGIRNAHVFLPKNITETFNKYAVDWSEEGLKFYFNDILIWEDYIDSKHETLHKYPMHVIINHGITSNTSIDLIDNVCDDLEVKSVKIFKKI